MKIIKKTPWSAIREHISWFYPSLDTFQNNTALHTKQHFTHITHEHKYTHKHSSSPNSHNTHPKPPR